MFGFFTRVSTKDNLIIAESYYLFTEIIVSTNMKEIRSILDAYRKIDFRHQKAALAMVVRVEGSSYRRMGARMFVLDDGNFVGGISGGCLEGDARRRALKAIAGDKPSIVTYDTTQEDENQIGVGLGCNGIIDVMFIPLNGKDDAVSTLKEIECTRVPQAILTTIDSIETEKIGRSYLYHESNVNDEIKKIVNNAMSSKKSLIHQSGKEKTLIEIVIPAIHLQIYGSNYDVYTLSRIAEELGWDISLVGKAEKINRNIASTTKIYSQYLSERPAIDEYSAAVLMSHDLATDKKNLQQLINTDISYIGLLGPAKRKEKLFDGIELSTTMHERLYGPAGLDIGANTPEEIAIAITSEIIAHFSNREGRSLRIKNGPIHENHTP